MAGSVVEMDYTVMANVAKGYKTASDTLKQIAQVMSKIIEMLRMLGFASAGTSAALAAYLEIIKRNIENLSKTCLEFEADLKTAVRIHQTGDKTARSPFGDGIRG
jgi:phage-related minor tail protein